VLTIFSVVRHDQRKVEADVPSAALLHEQRFVLGAASALYAEADSRRRIDQDQPNRKF